MSDASRSAEGVTTALTADAVEPADFARILVEGCLEALRADAAALLFADGPVAVRLAAATGAAAEAVVRAEAAAYTGPDIDCHRTCHLVRAHAVRDAARWPSWSARMRAARLVLGYALPVQRDDRCIGVLALLFSDVRPMSDQALALARTLASSAAAALAQRDAMLRQAGVIDQLQGALRSRIHIEQAKGILAERHGISVDAAFDTLRRYSRRHGRRLDDVSSDVIEGRVRIPPP